MYAINSATFLAIHFLSRKALYFVTGANKYDSLILKYNCTDIRHIIRSWMLQTLVITVTL